MPFRNDIGKEVTRSTICVRRWQVSVTIMCADVIPVGQAAPLFVAIQWRRKRNGSEEPGQPDDAKPVVIEFRPATQTPHGDIRFDNAGGARFWGSTRDERRLLTIFGLSGSAGARPDVNLVVKIEGEDVATLPLSVGASPTALTIAAEGGADAAPEFLAIKTPFRLRAVPTPAGAGTFRWESVHPAAAAITAGANEQTVTITGHHPAGAPPVSAATPVTLCALFTPAGGPSVMAVHHFVRDANFSGQIEDRSVAPEFAGPAARAFLAAGTPFIIKSSQGAVVFSGMTGPDGRFDATLPPVGGPYTLEVPGFAGIAP